MVAADDDECVVELAGGFEAAEEDTDGGVEGLDFAEVVGEVLAGGGDVGEVRRDAALEAVGVDVPEGLAGALFP